MVYSYRPVLQNVSSLFMDCDDLTLRRLLTDGTIFVCCGVER
jgi:hypothetical protein